MNEKWQLYRQKLIDFWNEKTKKQKWILFGSAAGVAVFIVLLLFFITRTDYEPLYTNLPLQEAGQIKEMLDAKGVPSVITDNGSTILVPKDRVDALKVELAAEGIPNSGTINYSFFEERAGFGMTDNEFSVLERAAMQTELANLIRRIDGVRDANVMITLPEESIWVNASDEEATAAIVLTLEPGKKLEQKEVQALFHLVSKSVPNLPIHNIVISDQMFNDYVYEDEDNSDSTLSVYEQQRAIKREIEQDLARNIQQMLGTVIGRDKVLVSVTTDIDFTKENRTEALVEPVDIENMEGIPISIERIQESYSGEGAPEGGIPGVGEEIPAYNTGLGGEGPVDWERTEDRINNEVNRINREIVESPYEIRDIGIQVMVEPPDGEEELPPERLEDIQQLLATIIRTSIPNEYTAEWTDDDIDERILVSSQVFDGKIVLDEEPQTAIPLWLYVVGALLVATIIVLAFLLWRKRREEEVDEVVEEAIEQTIPELPDEDTGEKAMKRKQIEKLALEKPEEFSKLLRTWLSED